MHCRTCTAGLAHHTLYSVIPHTALPHCTTLQYTLQYTHHILHHHTARVIYQLGGAQLQTQLQTPLHTPLHTPLRIPRGGPKPALCRTHLHTVTCTSSVRCDSSLLSATLCVVCVVWWCNKIFQLWTLDLKNFIHKHRYKCKCKYNCKYNCNYYYKHNHNHNHNHNNNV